jgi:glycosyltransferase involved in cell wall biosynthesis
MTGPRVLLVIPCYNESKSLGSLLAEIASLNAGCETLVVDDGSTDQTYEIANDANYRLKLLTNLGIGGAVQSGIKFAATRGFDFCIQIDGDGQHPPDQIAALLDAQKRSGANIVIGSRYLQGSTYCSTWSRRLGSRIIGRAIGLLYNVPTITDPTSGMRVMDHLAISYFSQQYPHDFPEPISLAWALRSGLTMHECPVEMRAREHGKSSISGLKSFAYMVRVLAYIVLSKFRPTPTGERP